MNDDLARALDACLSLVRQGQSPEQSLARFPKHRAALAPLLRAALAVERSEPVNAPEDWQAIGRARLMNRIAARHPAPLHPDRRAGLLRWSPLAGAVAAVLAVAMLSGGAVIASAGALPDEPLYPVKQAVETLQVALAASEVDRAGLYLEFAERRWNEEAVLAERGRVAGAQAAATAYGAALDRTILTIEQERSSGSPVASLVDRLNEHLDRHEAQMEAVFDQVPAAAQPAIERAMEASRHGQERAAELRADKAAPTKGQTGAANGSPVSTGMPTATPDTRDAAGKEDNKGSDTRPDRSTTPAGKEKVPPGRR